MTLSHSNGKRRSLFRRAHGPVSRIGLLLVHVIEADVAKHALDVDRVVLVGVRLGGLHQREERGWQVLNDWTLRVVIRHDKSPTGLQDAHRFLHQSQRGVFRALVDDKRERHDVKTLIRVLGVLTLTVDPASAFTPRDASVSRGSDREHVGRQIHADDVRRGKRIGNVSRRHADGATDVENLLRFDIRRGVVLFSVFSESVRVRVSQPTLRSLCRDSILWPHSQRHGIRGALRLERGQPAEVTLGVGVERLEVILWVLDLFPLDGLVRVVHILVRFQPGGFVSPSDAILLRSVDQRPSRHGFHDFLVQQLVRDGGVHDFAEKVFLSSPVWFHFATGIRRVRRARDETRRRRC